MARWMKPRNLALVLALGVPLIFAAHGIRFVPVVQAGGSSAGASKTSWNEAGPSCRVGAGGAGAARISLAELQKRLAGRGGGDAPEDIVILNGSGYNYGGDVMRLEDAALRFEATQGAR